MVHQGHDNVLHRVPQGHEHAVAHFLLVLVTDAIGFQQAQIHHLVDCVRDARDEMPPGITQVAGS